MTYTIRIEAAPTHELAISLAGYLHPKTHRNMDLGAAWAKSVKEQLDESFAAELEELIKQPPRLDLVHLLLMRSPEPEIDGFLRWLGALTPGELYERTAPCHQGLPPDLGAVRDQLHPLLTRWHDQYFKTIDPAILPHIQADAGEKAALTGTVSAVKLVEQATGGLVVEPEDGLNEVVLIPQYHYRPNILVTCYGPFTAYFYPVQDLPAADPDQPAPRLLRVARALADESRLRILRYVAGGPRSFTEIVKFTGLALSTVHHHMLTLRAAGLVRVHDSGLTPGQNARYTFRPTALADLNNRLAAFIQGD